MTVISKRTAANSVTGAVTAFSAVGGFGPVVLRMVGLIDLASDIDWATTLLVHPDIQWPAVFRLTAVIGLALMLGLNWELTTKAIRGIRKHFQHTFDGSARDAIFHIAHRSTLCVGMSDQDRFAFAVNAFNEAMRSGKIKLKGREPRNPVPKKIPKRRVLYAHLEVGSVAKIDQGTGGRILGEDEKILFEGVMVDLGEVASIWPKRIQNDYVRL